MTWDIQQKMRAVIIGGGKGCRAIIELAGGTFLKELKLEILCVVDPDPNAPGMVFAREHGIPTSKDMKEALSTIPDIKLIMELTGSDEVLEDIYKMIPRGIKVFDHTFSRIFWELGNAQRESIRQIKEITELEQKIEKERSSLQLLFDKIPELVIVLDREHKIIKINESFASFIGLKLSDVVDKTIREVFAGTELHETSDQTVGILNQIGKTGEPGSFIWQSPSRNEVIWEVTLTPIKTPDGEIEEILGTWHRITEQVILQRKIESAELRFKSFIDSASDWISVKDLNGRYIIVNKIIADSLHMKPEEFVGRLPEEIVPEELAGIIHEHDKIVISDDHHRTFEEIVPIDGRDHHFQTARFPLRDYKGSIQGTCTIMRDITSEVVLKEQLIQAGKLAAMGKLAAGVAHEINNPLTGILAYAEDMAEDFPGNDPRQKDLQVIIRETLRCRDIVRNLLDFARQEKPKLEKLIPNSVIEQSLSLIGKLPQFRNITIEIALDEDIPFIQGDPRQLQQVILNFLMNSSEAMNGRGVIGISTGYEPSTDKCYITVEDEGPGISEDKIDKIFEPFFSTKETSGLGLAVSWGIIDRHRGSIEVERSSKGGALFRIVLPAYEYLEER
ncbi:MAG: PAS domain-containing protein [Candidatus Zixiibacteriota bacterium]|nr:MAG: PAS domain-containing protein [candidate division Zixibacteria bacterium]